MNPSIQQPTAPPPASPPMGDRPRSRTVPVTASVVAAAGVLATVIWAIGGFRAQPAVPDPVGQGATIAQGRFSVRIVGARTGSAKVKLAQTSVPVLMVRMRVTNTGKDTVTMADTAFGFASGVLLAPAPYRFPDDVQSDPAKGAADALQPRLPRDIDAIWKLTGPPPRQVTVDLRQWTYQLQFDRGGYYWSTGKSAATTALVTMPVRQGAAG